MAVITKTVPTLSELQEILTLHTMFSTAPGKKRYFKCLDYLEDKKKKSLIQKIRCFAISIVSSNH